MFTSMFAKTETFETKYPLFVDIFSEPFIRQNMMNNEDLVRKYNANNAIIKTFIYELRKRFDIETVRKIVEDTILKFPDNLLITFVTSYLNSDEATKSNSDVVSYFKKTMNLPKNSEECINYITENGIVASRKYKDLPNIVIDDKYKELRSDTYTYYEGKKNVKLDDVYYDLTYPERELVIDLLEKGSFDLLDPIFERFDYSLRTVLSILTIKGIDSKIINHEVVESLTPYFTMLMILFIIETEKHVNVINNLVELINTSRWEMIKYLICYSLIDSLGDLSVIEVSSLNDEELKSKFTIEEIKLGKKED